MYNGPNGPVAFLVHVMVRRPILSVAIAALGLGATIGYVNRTPGGPGVHSGSASVLNRVEEQLKEDHPEYRQLFPAYEAAYKEARRQRAVTKNGAKLSDKTVEYVLREFGSGLTVRDARANAGLMATVEKAYFFDLIHRYNGNIDFATASYVNTP